MCYRNKNVKVHWNIEIESIYNIRSLRSTCINEYFRCRSMNSTHPTPPPIMMITMATFSKPSCTLQVIFKIIHVPSYFASIGKF